MTIKEWREVVERPEPLVDLLVRPGLGVALIPVLGMSQALQLGLRHRHGDGNRKNPRLEVDRCLEFDPDVGGDAIRACGFLFRALRYYWPEFDQSRYLDT